MFGNDDLNKAISAALNQPDIVPAGKKMALVAVAQTGGMARRRHRRGRQAGRKLVIEPSIHYLGYFYPGFWP